MVRGDCGLWLFPELEPGDGHKATVREGAGEEGGGTGPGDRMPGDIDTDRVCKTNNTSFWACTNGQCVGDVRGVVWRRGGRW